MIADLAGFRVEQRPRYIRENYQKLGVVDIEATGNRDCEQA